RVTPRSIRAWRRRSAATADRNVHRLELKRRPQAPFFVWQWSHFSRPGWPINVRPGRRQRNVVGDFLWRRRTNIPLAHAIAAAPFDEIDVYVRLMRAIRTRSEHRAEPTARAFTQVIAKILCHGHVRQRHNPSVRQYE